MSFVVAVKGSEGIALAADSRAITFEHGRDYWTYDSFPKIFAMPAPHRAGIILSGEWPKALGSVRVAVEGLTAALPGRLSIAECAGRLSELLARSPVPFAAIALVVGYDDTGGHVFQVGGETVEQHAGSVGITYGGMRDAVDRLLQGTDGAVLERLREQGVVADVTRPFPLHLSTMGLDETVDLARYLMDVTLGALRFGGEYAYQGTGGPVELATVTAKGFRWIQQREGQDDLAVTTRQRTVVPLAVRVVTPEDLDLPSTYTVVDNKEPAAVR